MELIPSVITTLGGCFLFYLSSPNQQWRTTALPRKPWRLLAWFLLLLAFPLWMTALNAKAGFFAAWVLIMLALGTIPLLSLLRQHNKGLTDEQD